MKKSFLKFDRPWLTGFIITDEAEAAIEMVKKGIREGADSIGIEITRLKPEYWNRETLTRIFEACGDLPIYACCYRTGYGEGKTDDELAELMHLSLSCGATLIDVMGDLYDPVPWELTETPEAVKKQKALIEDLKDKGAEILISSHNHAFYDTEHILHWAKEQEARGADVVKIIGIADTEEELVTNLKTYQVLNAELEKPYLFMVGGEWCMLTRECAGRLGAFMYLGRLFEDGVQPKLETLRYMRDEMILKD